MQKGDIDMFSSLQDLVGGASINKKELFSTISQHVKKLAVSFGQYFPESPDPQKGSLKLVFIRRKLLA